MRIRSIKPEFWRSSDISRLAIEDRLLFVGLWSYVDDSGVGEDKLAAITADLFADDLERDAPETFARVSRGLARLSEGDLIVRYAVANRDFLEITNWRKHQRIDKPGKARFPRSDDESAVIREGVARPRESVAPGTGEQGNRGTGEQRSRGEVEIAPAIQRPDIENLCQLLNELKARNGDKTTPVTKAWRTAARLLIDTDGRDPQEAAHLVRWALNDNFWKGNIQSMPKFREKYDTLRHQANRQHTAPQSRSDEAAAFLSQLGGGQ